ncbi:DUF3253 domain-containing protein [uncultured Algoriphagus sp.]|uniref:DUF3253 domain-containing protein n=1 Tax=uncultured Algoriphagus sp. TaxID=417365 RepID=UPI0030EB2FDF|tara:strand:- start:6497 stop:6742 length:246 start_codon:yes stop_codon:yes gene_type:complete
MEVLRSAILDMLRRKKGKTFNSSEVVRQMFPEDWEQFLEDVNDEAKSLSREGLITISTDKSEVDSDPANALTLEISSPNKL